MGGAAFVYGTLMADEVLKLLIKRVPRSQPATLKGYARYQVKGQVFPAIVPATPQNKVAGKVLLELTPKELNILDVYESEEYYRAAVEPELADGSTVAADVYVWKDEFRHMLDGEWRYEEWREQHLQRWTQRLAPNGSHPTGDLTD